MKRNVFFAIGLVIILLMNGLAFLQKNGHERAAFNITSANQTFNTIQKNLDSSKEKDYSNVLMHLRQLDGLDRDAKKCIDESEAHLKTINELLKTTNGDGPTQLQRADVQYLENKRSQHIKALSECRLFVFRTDEFRSRYKEIALELSTNQILKRGTPIWKMHQWDFEQLAEKFDSQKAIDISGIFLIKLNQWLIFLVILLLASFVAHYIKKYLKTTLANGKQMPQTWRGFLKVTVSFIMPVTIFLFSSMFLSLIYQDFSVTPTLELISHAILISLLSLALIKFIFYPAPSLKAVIVLPDNLGRLIYRCAILVVAIIFIAYAGTLFLRDQVLPIHFIELSRLIFLTFMALVIAWIFLVGCRSVHKMHLDSANFILAALFFAIIAISLLVIEWLGYHRLDIFLAQGLFSTLIVTLVAVLLWHLVESFYVFINEKQHPFSKQFHQWFGVKYNRKMPEIFLIKLAINLIIVGIFVLMVLKSWSISAVFVDKVAEGMWQGFKIWGVKITPSRLVISLLVFAIILLAGRMIATNIAKKHRFKGEEETQIAISTITVYVAFALAFIFAMMVIGVDFTGLAIIAGALSVGVGLGLQNIVNNFVSGLILLIEKPIKPGDRIVIGKTEGFVKKIRIRSTQIATLAKEDVIVPNADLITQQVTNYMFRDRNARVNCQVGVAYGTDTDLVKKVLLEVASKQSDIVHDTPNEPFVLFTSFGDSALIFDLYCVIHDVNKKYLVRSNLNFGINEAFKQHQIEIAFPQREIRLKENISISKSTGTEQNESAKES